MREGAFVPPGETADRLSADDLATQREAEHLELALQAQRARAAAQAGPLGSCANCQARCAPLARYCDDECRADHETRQRVLARQGRA